MLQISSVENYPAYTNIPNTIELVASWDIPLAGGGNVLYFGGVKGALDKLCITQPFTGIYRIQYQDVFQTEPYPPQTAQPITVYQPKVERRNTLKIQHVQVSLSNWQTGQSAPSGHYARVWWYNPVIFPTQMAPADPNYQDSIIVSIYNPETLTVENVAGMRANIIVTILDSFNNANILPQG